MLYWSYARREADEGSVVDLLLLLEGETVPAGELLGAQDVKWPLALEVGYTVSLLPVSGEDYERSQEPCLRNARRGPRRLREAEALLGKAERYFGAAALLLGAGNPDFAASRAYYGCFCAAEALLLSKGPKQGGIDRRLHKLLDEAFSLHQSADYAAEADIAAEEVRRMISEGRGFLVILHKSSQIADIVSVIKRLQAGEQLLSQREIQG